MCFTLFRIRTTLEVANELLVLAEDVVSTKLRPLRDTTMRSESSSEISFSVLAAAIGNNITGKFELDSMYYISLHYTIRVCRWGTRVEAGSKWTWNMLLVCDYPQCVLLCAGMYMVGLKCVCLCVYVYLYMFVGVCVFV